MSQRKRAATMDDAFMDDELSMMALEILNDFPNESSKQNSNEFDSFLFRLVINDIDIDDEMVSESLEIPDMFHQKSLTIISDISTNDSLNGLLPAIPSIGSNSSKSSHSKSKRPQHSKIHIAGNKKRGIKSWSKKQQKSSDFPSDATMTDDVNKHRKLTVIKDQKKKHKKHNKKRTKNVTNKKRKHRKHRKHRSDDLMQIQLDSNDAIFNHGDDINISHQIEEPLPYFLKRGVSASNNPFSVYYVDKNDENDPFPPDPSKIGDIINNKARKSKKRKKPKNRRTRRSGTLQPLSRSDKKQISKTPKQFYAYC